MYSTVQLLYVYIRQEPRVGSADCHVSNQRIATCRISWLPCVRSADCHDNVLMFYGQQIVGHCLIEIYAVTSPFFVQKINIFHCFFFHNKEALTCCRVVVVAMLKNCHVERNSTDIFSWLFVLIEMCDLYFPQERLASFISESWLIL